MAYSKEFKLELINAYNSQGNSISKIAREKNIPKQTLSRWIKIYEKFGEIALENKKPGTKEKPIDETLERNILDLWSKEERSVYRMRIDLRGKGFNFSERDIRKVYLKHNLIYKAKNNK